MTSITRLPHLIACLCTIICCSFSGYQQPFDTDSIVSYVADPQKQDVQLYWKDDNGNTILTIDNLKQIIEKKNSKLVFAMNGGMFTPAYAPVGLLVTQGKTINPIVTADGSGNFYLKPNGVFYITKNKKAGICETGAFASLSNVAWATQSGPMLVIDGSIHAAFKKGSANVNIRNGVGILPDERIVFAISKKEINFYDFAEYFKNLGCKNALYLDGFVSRMYLPAKNILDTDGNFGVLIGVTEKTP